MSDEDEIDTIARKARRLEEARDRRRDSALYGLGMFGMVGWAVAVPIIAGIALGLWIDRQWPSETSWTLVLLLAGAALCFLVFTASLILSATSQAGLDRADPTRRVFVSGGRYFGTRPPSCGHLYNVGRSREWQECMGVGPK